MKTASLRRLGLCAASAMLLASCNRLQLENLPAPLEVGLPTTCEDILAPVPVPEARPEDDAIKAFLENRAAAIVASAEVDLGRECLVKQRNDYAAGRDLR